MQNGQGLLGFYILVKIPKYKGGQVTKPVILVKICYTLLYVIQGVIDKVPSWPQLISKLLVTPMYVPAASDWPHTFYTQGVFV